MLSQGFKQRRIRRISLGSKTKMNGKGKLNIPDREERLMNDRLASTSSHF